MNNEWIILAICLVVSSYSNNGHAESSNGGADVSFHWMAGKLIPNEFGLPDGTWSGSTLRECILKCSTDKNCVGFSVEKKFGNAWEAGCEGTLCDEETECHAKGDYGSSDLWLPNDAKIRVPSVDAKSNTWIQNWGTILKK